VSFADLSGRDLRLLAPQPSTDKGDPADAVGDEPAPNDARINMGAFGGTADAEQSALSTVVGGTGSTPSPTPDPKPPGQTTGSPAEDGGCAVGGRPGAGWIVVLALAALARRRRTR
jgi:MYXO-CTERM domain-containing protein